MLHRIVHVFIAAGAFLLVARMVPGFVVPDFKVAFVVSMIYGVLTVLASIVLFPLAWTLFIFVPRPLWKILCLVFVNAGLLLACTFIVREFQVRDYGQACVAALMLSVITGILDRIWG